MESLGPRYRTTKRTFSHHNGDNEDYYTSRPKRHAPDESQNGRPLTPPGISKPTEIVFRIICPESRAGCVIGKGGSIIKSLRQDTGAKITIADAAEGADDRVIFISSAVPENQNGYGKDDVKESKEGSKDDADKNTHINNDSSMNEVLSPAQEALLKIHDHIIEGSDLKSDSEEGSSLLVTRLLIPSSQVGCLLGKGGKIIEQMRQESKAKIRIVACEKNLLGLMPFDEILQITGDVDAIKRAIHLAAQRLQENPAQEHIQFSSIGPPRTGVEDLDVSRSMSDSRRSADLHQQRHSSFTPDMEPHNARYSRGYQSGVSESAWPGRAAKDGITFRILCPNEKIGGIIGKGGSIIRGLQEDIGVKIKVMDPVVGSSERIVAIFSIEHPEDDISPAQEALLHVQSKIADLGTDEDAVITSRLLVPSDEVGCLLGKGGSIITEIRKSTRANIRILGKDDLPKCAPASDELVQIVGDIRVAREALIQITERLRRKCQQKKLHGNLVETLARSTDSWRHDVASPGRMEFQRHGVHGLGPPSSSYHSFIPSPGRWTGQDVPGVRTFSDYDHPPPTQPPLDYRLSGALVTRTTVEVMIPAHAVTSIIGDGGNRIVQIRQMSGAKVDLLDVVSGTSEGIVKISGTPEQTQSAQRLLQELILNAQTSSLGYT